MTKDVIISIRGMQDYQGSDSDQVELMTEGTLSREDFLPGRNLQGS